MRQAGAGVWSDSCIRDILDASPFVELSTLELGTGRQYEKCYLFLNKEELETPYRHLPKCTGEAYFHDP